MDQVEESDGVTLTSAECERLEDDTVPSDDTVRVGVSVKEGVAVTVSVIESEVVADLDPEGCSLLSVTLMDCEVELDTLRENVLGESLMDVVWVVVGSSEAVGLSVFVRDANALDDLLIVGVTL